MKNISEAMAAGAIVAAMDRAKITEDRRAEFIERGRQAIGEVGNLNRAQRRAAAAIGRKDEARARADRQRASRGKVPA